MYYQKLKITMISVICTISSPYLTARFTVLCDIFAHFSNIFGIYFGIYFWPIHVLNES